ncbi:MAG: SAM-dependent methyltransferase [Comamonas sp.]
MQIRSLLDRQQFFDPDGAALRLGISDAIWPLFGLLWPSGSELANHMAQQPVIQGQRILELGCGLGLASLVCHRMGADITASDCHPLAGDFLKENLRLNDLSPMKYRSGHWGALESIAAAAEAAAVFDAAAQIAALTDGVLSGLVAPIADLPVHGLFDLIIGSDLLYERDQFARLPNYICEHASASAQIWIIDPDRGNRAAFSRQMAERGFDVTETRLDRAETEFELGYKGRLLVYARQKLPN